MMIDKNGKLFSKISVIDIVIVLALILCIAAAFIRFSGILGNNSTTPVEFEYVVKVQKIRDKSANAILKKGSLYSNLADGSYMGEIIDVKKVPNEESVVLVDGKIVNASAPERYDVYITVKSSGKQTDTAIYTSGGKKIEIGSTEYVATKYVAAEAQIIDVDIIK